MKRHASADELAELSAGVLRPRKAAKIAAHLAGCAHCTEISNQLASVSSVLASVPVAPMPAEMSGRIEVALAAESAQRLASTPATEAGRRDLPARARQSRSTGQGWRIFGLSGSASRLVAAAGALVVIGGGGYEIATHFNTGPSGSAASTAAGSAPVPGQQLRLAGPNVAFRHGRATQSLPTVRSDSNFTSANLPSKAFASVAAAREQGVVPRPSAAPAAHSAFTTSPKASGTNSADQSAARPSQAMLTSCVDKLAAGKTVLLVELAKFDGKPATIIVVAASKPAGSADVWAVSPSCSAGNTHVLDHSVVAHI